MLLCSLFPDFVVLCWSWGVSSNALSMKSVARMPVRREHRTSRAFAEMRTCTFAILDIWLRHAGQLLPVASRLNRLKTLDLLDAGWRECAYICITMADRSSFSFPMFVAQHHMGVKYFGARYWLALGCTVVICTSGSEQCKQRPHTKKASPRSMSNDRSIPQCACRCITCQSRCITYSSIRSTTTLPIRASTTIGPFFTVTSTRILVILCQHAALRPSQMFFSDLWLHALLAHTM